MKKTIIAMFLVISFTLAMASQKEMVTKKATDSNGYSYEYVTNDPMGLRLYTLKNGLKVYLSQNKEKPRIQTVIAVKAGSKNDPANTTGLAHYLEHMMFKGSEKIGTVNWEKEKPIIEKISELYEKHLKTSDKEEKKKIYSEIDKLSQEAAQYAIPSEYDKMTGAIGGEGSNAFTSDDSTMYVKDIPANELERWLELERERFDSLVLRLFHTELETVYEEFNIGQDNDIMRGFLKLRETLFEGHPYERTAIGIPEHLKNPSMKNIINFWKTYYAPNNMAICLSGDIDYEKTIKIVSDKYESMKPNMKLPEYKPGNPAVIEKPVEKHVNGPNTNVLMVGYRLGGTTSKDAVLQYLLSQVVANGSTGLIDIDINQQQKMLQGFAEYSTMNDYGMFLIGGVPKEGQSLDDVRALVFEEINKLKKGEFPDWMVEAIANNIKVNQIRAAESNGRVYDFANTFISGKKWEDELKLKEQITKYTKNDIIEFAKKNFGENYAIVYKHTGVPDDIVKVEKPVITPVQMNREQTSEYMKKFVTREAGRLTPQFVDYEKAIEKAEYSSGIEFNYIKNKDNELFNLVYIIDMGRNEDKKLALAVEYLPYIGTSKYSAAELQQEFYKLGLSTGVSAGDDRAYIYMNGLSSSFDKGLQLFEHIIADAKADDQAYYMLADRILKAMAEAKLNFNNILWNGMVSYAMYENESPFKTVYTLQEMQNIKPDELVEKLKGLTGYKHRIFYYGPEEKNIIVDKIKKNHKIPLELKDVPDEKTFAEKKNEKPVVYFVDYKNNQANIILLAKDKGYSPEKLPLINMYNEFYGSGLSSVVFQEIREAKALAYSAFSQYSIPDKKWKPAYLYNFVGTQSDKMVEAVDTMKSLLTTMPEAASQFELARISSEKRIESNRVTKEAVFWNWLNMKELGLNLDYEKKEYESIKKITIEDMKEFFGKHISGKNYSLLVIGDKTAIDLKALEKYGEVKELSLEEVFGY